MTSLPDTLRSLIVITVFVPAVLTGSAHLADAAGFSPDRGNSLPVDVAALAGLAPLPAAEPVPAGALADEVARLGTRLGIGTDPAAVAAAVAAAGLSPELDAALAGLVVRLATCADHTDALLARTPHADLVAGTATPDPADVAALRGCAVSLRTAVEAARPVLATATADGPLTLWPVLSYSPGATDDVYAEDFVLSIDQGGDDTYLNNQGSNELDLKRSLTNPAAPRFGEAARGCRMTYPDSVSGRIEDEPGPDGERVLSMDGPECVPVAGLLWDQAGDDTYGRREAPTFPDSQCSADPSVARFTTIGSGVEGVSIVIDDAGDDAYTGKTGTMGAGHMGGVGLLHDVAGNDSYLAIRNGQGLGLLAGTGILRDDAGDDVYDYYLPAPLDPAAEFHTDGSGGVVDDAGLFSEVMRSPNPADGVGGRCDAKPRSLQGVGIFVAPAIGLLVDGAGTDSYRAAGYDNQEEGFPTQSGTGLVRFAHGSQGSGFLGGFGALLDLAGPDDAYLREAYEPATDRGNGQTVGPQSDLTFDEVGSPTNGKPLDLSVFVDTE
ncbi:MAG: hypothetical protein ACT4RN_17825 [Pseudonocardia sp.]